MRTFITLRDGDSPAQHLVLANCERGEMTNPAAVLQLNQTYKALDESTPNIPAISARDAFDLSLVDRYIQQPSHKRSHEEKRTEICVGMPRVLNMYSYAPFFISYLRSLGVRKENIVFSGVTSQTLCRNATGFASIDPCYPSKICVAHIQDLLKQGQGKRLDVIFFPCFDRLISPLMECVGDSACPAGAVTPDAVKSVFSLSRQSFAKQGVQYLDPLLDFSDMAMLTRQMYDAWSPVLNVSWSDNAKAVSAGLSALSRFEQSMEALSLKALQRLELEGRVGLVALGRPYHHDSGLNHGVFEELHKLGYTIFSQSHLPMDVALLERLFGEDVRQGVINSPLSIADVWPTSNSAGANRKVWAAKFAAAHPNLMPLELSSFKCGHDAFISRVLQKIAAAAGKPHFYFGDLDENRSVGALQIRIETIHHFLRKYEIGLKMTAKTM